MKRPVPEVKELSAEGSVTTVPNGDVPSQSHREW